MAARNWLTLTAAALVLAGCASVLPERGDEQDDSRLLFATRPDSPEAAERAENMTIGTELPEGNAIDTGRARGVGRGDCRTPSGLEEGYDNALRDLRIKVANDGADYLQILGRGPIGERGMCDEGYYRIDGRGFRTQGFADSTTAGSASGNAGRSADSLTSRLEELEALRERGLITEQEYEQLRERVLSDPY